MEKCCFDFETGNRKWIMQKTEKKVKNLYVSPSDITTRFIFSEYPVPYRSLLRVAGFLDFVHHPEL
jgi:hypothetical protein